MFGLSQIRLYAYAAIALAIAGLLAHDHWMSRRYRAASADRAQLTATLAAERKANIAEVAHVQEDATTIKFRANDPLHGGLCVKPNLQAAATKQVNGGPGAAPADIQPMPAGDPEASGPGNPDVRHLLDVLAGRADEVSARLREWQGR